MTGSSKRDERGKHPGRQTLQGLASGLGTEPVIERLERLTLDPLKSLASSEAQGGTALLSVMGPAGAGKTTVTTRLSSGYATILESVTDNPYLASLDNRRDGGFQAFDNQRWFLKRVCDQLAEKDPSQILIIDQDPAAIVHVYARQFLAEGLLDSSEYRKLLLLLVEMRPMLTRWKRRLLAFLDAPAETLRKRAVARGDASVPDLSWFAAIRSRFLALADEIPQALRIRTGELAVEEVVALIEDYLQQQTDSSW